MRSGILGGAILKIERTAHIHWACEGPARCQPQTRHVLGVFSFYPQSRGRCWVETTPSTARTPRSAVRCDARVRPRGRSSGVWTRSSWPRGCHWAGSVKSRGREARAGLGQGGPSRLREYRVGAQKTVSVLWGIQGKPSGQPLGTDHLQAAENLGQDQVRGWSEQEALGSGTGMGSLQPWTERCPVGFSFPALSPHSAP